MSALAGCEDPLDHSQHNVVDIAPAQLDELLKESGHFDDVIELEVRIMFPSHSTVEYAHTPCTSVPGCVNRLNSC